jgi:hypothetical protein
MLPWSGSIWWVGRSVGCDKGEKKIEREREREWREHRIKITAAADGSIN